eukprot:gene16889-biopygen10632
MYGPTMELRGGGTLLPLVDSIPGIHDPSIQCVRVWGQGSSPPHLVFHRSDPRLARVSFGGATARSEGHAAAGPAARTTDRHPAALAVRRCYLMTAMKRSSLDFAIEVAFLLRPAQGSPGIQPSSPEQGGRKHRVFKWPGRTKQRKHTENPAREVHLELRTSRTSRALPAPLLRADAPLRPPRASAGQGCQVLHGRWRTSGGLGGLAASLADMADMADTAWRTWRTWRTRPGGLGGLGGLRLADMADSEGGSGGLGGLDRGPWRTWRTVDGRSGGLFISCRPTLGAREGWAEVWEVYWEFAGWRARERRRLGRAGERRRQGRWPTAGELGGLPASVADLADTADWPGGHGGHGGLADLADLAWRTWRTRRTWRTGSGGLGGLWRTQRVLADLADLADLAG